MRARITICMTTVLAVGCLWLAVGVAPAEGARTGTLQVLLTQITMANPRTGWGMTTNSVVRTSDGGRHWRTVLVIPRRTGVAGIAFTSQGSRRAWAIQVGLSSLWDYRSSDGGRTWSRGFQSAPRSAGYGMPVQLVFSDPKHGWMLLHGAGGGAAGHISNVVISTTDGGKFWKRVEFNSMGTASPRAIPDCDDDSATLSARGANDVWVTGMCGAATQLKEIFLSSDGGRRWRTATVQNPFNHLQYFNPGQVVVGAKWTAVPVTVWKPARFILYRSQAGGTTFTPTKPIKLSTSTFPIGQVVYGAFSNNLSWVLTRTQSNKGYRTPILWRTSTAGRKWSRLGKFPALANATQLDFVTSAKGFALATSSRVYVTNDGGRRWSAVTPG